MDYFSLVHLIALFHSVVAPLPAPVNVSVFSVNFRHVLRWDPGPGTPPGTVYKILVRVNRRKQLQNTTDATSFKLTLHNEKKYCLMVQAVFNETFSAESRSVLFTPYHDTKIGPPQLSLAGCSNRIHVNITLPEADRRSKIKDIQEFYGSEFRVLWWKKTEKEERAVKSIPVHNKSFTLPNLESGVEYCVQVHINIRINKNTEPSAEYCSFTSHHEETRIGPVVIGGVAVPLIVVVVSMLCLHYTGFLCKVKAALPRDLIAVLSHGYVMTPERTIPDQLSLCSEMGKNRKHNPTTLPSAKRETNSVGEDDDEDEEDEDEMQVYLDRVGELSSDERSRQGSGNTSGNSNIAASRYSGSFTEKLSAKVETLHAEFDQDEVKAEETEVSFMHRGSEPGVQRQVANEFEEMEEEEDEVMNISGDVNLFSVTLGALAACDEEEQEEEQEAEQEEEEEAEQNTEVSLTDLLTLSSQEHKLVLDSSLDLSHADTQTESYDQTGGLSHSTHKDYCDWR